MRRANLGRMGGLSDRRSFSSPSLARWMRNDDERRRRHIVCATTTMSGESVHVRAWAATSSTNNHCRVCARHQTRLLEFFTPPPARAHPPAPSMPPLSFMPRETDRLGRCRRRRLSHSYCIKVLLHLRHVTFERGCETPISGDPRSIARSLARPSRGTSVKGKRRPLPPPSTTWAPSARARFSTPTEHLSSRDLSGMSLQWMDRREEKEKEKERGPSRGARRKEGRIRNCEEWQFLAAASSPLLFPM